MPQAVWYCESGPGYKPSAEELALSAARHAEAAAAERPSREGALAAGATPAVADGLGWVPQRNPYESIWQPAPVTKGSAPHTISVDLRGLNGSGTVMAVRYAWPFSGDTCCPGQLVKTGLQICERAASDLLPPAFAKRERASAKWGCVVVRRPPGELPGAQRQHQPADEWILRHRRQPEEVQVPGAADVRRLTRSVN